MVWGKKLSRCHRHFSSISIGVDMKLPLRPFGDSPPPPPPKAIKDPEKDKKAKALSDALRAKSDSMKMVNER